MTTKPKTKPQTTKKSAPKPGTAPERVERKGEASAMQGEGDRESARKYEQHVETFIDEGRVEPAARAAAATLEEDADEASAAIAKAKERARKVGQPGGKPAPHR